MGSKGDFGHLQLSWSPADCTIQFIICNFRVLHCVSKKYTNQPPTIITVQCYVSVAYAVIVCLSVSVCAVILW